MNQPIINSKETFKGVDFLQAYQNSNMWYSLPVNNSWNFNNPNIISGRTIINARKDYLPAQTTINEFSSARNGAQIVPISPSSSSDNFEININYSATHSIRFNIIQDVPYPSLTFSATLDNSASDYSSVLNEIQQKLGDNTLLRGKLKISFSAVNILNRIFIKYNLRNVLHDILLMGNSNIHTKSNLENLLFNFLSNNFNSIINTSYNPLTNVEKSIIQDFLLTKIGNSIYTGAVDTRYFDQGLTFKTIKPRDPLELPNSHQEIELFRTQQQNVTLDL